MRTGCGVCIAARIDADRSAYAFARQESEEIAAAAAHLEHGTAAQVVTQALPNGRPLSEFVTTIDDLDDLFRTAAEGVFDYIVTNRDAVQVRETESITLRAEAPADLLVAWLNDLIFRCETRHRLYTRFDVRVSADGLGLDAEIGGEPIDRDRHVLDHEVKAATRHEASLRREEEGWVAELILDI